MSKLILVTGLSGSGKSYMARYLANCLLVPVYSKDDFKELFFDSFGISNLDAPRELGKAATQTLFYILDQELKNDRVVIAEAVFKLAEDRARFDDLVRLYGTQVLELHCTASEEILVKRVKARTTSKERHPGHADEQLFEKNFDASLPSIVGVGELVEIDTNKFEMVDYPKIAEQVKKFLAR